MLAIVLLTYDRLEYAKRTLQALRKNLRGAVDIKWIIASDGDTPDYIESVRQTLTDAGGSDFNVVVSNSERGGYGKNYNLAMQVAHEAEWVMPVEDDWELTRPFDVGSVIKDMQELEIGCARLGYIGYTQELRGHLKFGAACGHWLALDGSSPEPHVFAGHPRVESRDWSRAVGPWPEGLNPGETEFAVAHRDTARLQVAWPLDLVKPTGDLFAHIGTVRSY